MSLKERREPTGYFLVELLPQFIQVCSSPSLSLPTRPPQRPQRPIRSLGVPGTSSQGQSWLNLDGDTWAPSVSHSLDSMRSSFCPRRLGSSCFSGDSSCAPLASKVSGSGGGSISPLAFTVTPQLLRIETLSIPTTSHTRPSSFSTMRHSSLKLTVGRRISSCISEIELNTVRLQWTIKRHPEGVKRNNAFNNAPHFPSRISTLYRQVHEMDAAPRRPGQDHHRQVCRPPGDH